MTAFDRLAIASIILAGLLLSAIISLHHYGEKRYEAGYSAAVLAGKEQHDKDAEKYRKLESDTRIHDEKRDAEAQQKEQEYAQNLDAAQHRLRIGVDRLRCPTVSPVQPAAPSSDRSTPSEPSTDGSGPDIVPQVASDILGYGSAIASLVSRYERVAERFEECRQMNAK